MTIEEMAKAHIETVKKAVQDLMLSKEKVETEIARLEQYIVAGEAAISDHSHMNTKPQYDVPPENQILTGKANFVQ